MIDRIKFFQDLIESGAWPLRVGDLNCLVNFGNEREQEMINRRAVARKFTKRHEGRYWIARLETFAITVRTAETCHAVKNSFGGPQWPTFTPSYIDY
jgi:hypothetical protein